MITRPRLACLLALVALPALAAEVPPPKLADFARAWPIVTPVAGDMQRIVLPRGVYDAARSTELRDVVVLDADGQVVPSFLTTPQAEEVARPDDLPLRMFPIHDATLGRDQLERMIITARVGDAEVTVLSSADGMTHAALSPAPRILPPASYYIVVLPEPRPEGIESLRLHWSGVEGSFTAHVDAMTSDDLGVWRPAGNGVIAALERGSDRLVHDVVPVYPSLGKYLRLSLDGGAPDLALQNVELRFAEPPARHPREWFDLELSATETVFSLSPALPIDRFEVRPSPDAGLTQAELAVKGEAWRSVAKGVFYDLGLSDQRSASFSFPREHAVEWRVTLAGSNHGLLLLGWRPAELMFVVQGRAPYTLAAGSVRHLALGELRATLEASAETLWRARGEQAVVGDALLGESREVAGEAAYRENLGFTWRTVLLWVLLGLGVATVGFMAWQVSRKLEEPVA
jgi:hypothetical protein